MDIKELLIYANKLHSEYAESMANPNNNWSGRRLANYANGPIRGMYEENDNMLKTLMINNPDIENILKTYELDNYDEYELLKRTHGSLLTDNYYPTK